MSFQNLSEVSIALKNQFHNFRRVGNESLTSQYNRFVVLISKLQKASVQIDHCIMIHKLLDSLLSVSNWSPYIINIKREENLNTLLLEEVYTRLKPLEIFIDNYNVSSTSDEKVYHLTDIKKSSTSLVSEMPDSIPLEVSQSICSPACLITLNRYRNHNFCLINDMEKLRNVNIQLKNEESVYQTKIDALKKDLSDLNDQNCNLRAQNGDMLEQYMKMKEAKFEVDSRLEKYNFNTKLTNKLLDGLVVQKSKSGIGFTRVEPPLNHNYSCNPVSCDDDFDVSTPLTVNPPVLNCDNVSDACSDIIDKSVPVSVRNDDRLCEGCRNVSSVSNEMCEIESVDISHEVPFTILKHEHIPIKNHIITNEPSVSNERKLSVQNKQVNAVPNAQKGKMINLQNKMTFNQQNEHKPICSNKAKAKKQLNKFVHGGTSVHESAKFQNDDCFSHRKFHDKRFNSSQSETQLKSNDVSTSYDISEKRIKTCFTCGKNGHISRMCTEKRVRFENSRLKRGLENPKEKSRPTVPKAVCRKKNSVFRPP